MFKVIESSFGRYASHQLKNVETGEYVEIITEFGGMLNGFFIKNADDLVPILQGYKNEEELHKLFYSTFRGTKLSPFPNRIKGGSYSYNGTTFQMDINFPHEGNAIHGLVLSEPFKVSDSTEGEKGASITLSYAYQGKRQGYPFYYTIELEYVFEEQNILTTTTRIKNNDTKPIPMGDGWHPYFMTGSKADELLVQFPSKKVVRVDDALIPVGDFDKNELFRVPEAVGDRFIDNTFLVDDGHGFVESHLIDKKNAIRIKLWQETGEKKYKYLHVFTPPHRESLAMEPVTCPANAFNNKQDLFILHPNETHVLTWKIAVETGESE